MVFSLFIAIFTTSYCTKHCTIQSNVTPVPTRETIDSRASFLCCRSHSPSLYTSVKENSKCRKRRCTYLGSSMELPSFFLLFILYPLQHIIVEKALNCKELIVWKEARMERSVWNWGEITILHFLVRTAGVRLGMSCQFTAF